MSGAALSMIVGEGELDVCVAVRLASECGFSEAPVSFATDGSQGFWMRLPAFNRAAQATGFVIAQADFDRAGCVGPWLARKAPTRDRRLLLRLAVREIESWLLADVEGMSSFLKIARGLIPREPDNLHDPKQWLVNLAMRSRSREVREGMVPSKTSLAQVGTQYNPMLSGFVAAEWEPRRAALRSPSLSRAVRALCAAAARRESA